jgi:hypothetical protein
MEIKGPEKPIYSIEITKATRHDSPLLIPLLEQIDGEIDDVCGDKGLASRCNAQYIDKRGGTPFLMMKKNSTRKTKDLLHGERCTNPEKKTKKYGTNTTTNVPTARQDLTHSNNKQPLIFLAETRNVKPTRSG